MDVVLQLTHQSHAHRVVEYHHASSPSTACAAHAVSADSDDVDAASSAGADPGSGRRRPGARATGVFDDPACAGEQAVELAPRTNKTGRCLAMLVRPRAAPASFVQWLAAHRVLSRRVFRVYHVEATADPGSLPRTAGEVAAAVAAAGVPGPVRLQFAPAVAGREGDLANVGRALAAAGVALDPREFASVVHVVHIVLDDLAPDAGAARGDSGCGGGGGAAVEAGADNDAGARRRAARCRDTEPDVAMAWGWVPRDAYWHVGTDTVSISDGHAAKAVAKIAEAVHVAGVALGPSDDVLDVGAAPGSWSAWLSPRVRRVVAVDPAGLDPAVAALLNVVHVRKKAEDFDAATDVPGDPPFCPSLLVCDINAHPAEAARICKPLVATLSPGSAVLITLKFFGTGRDRDVAVAQVRDVLGPTVTDDVASAWMFASTVHERLFVATSAPLGDVAGVDAAPAPAAEATAAVPKR